jgi:hypothetical protein
MQTKTPGVLVGGSVFNMPTPDFLGEEVVANVPIGSTIKQGSCWCLDLSQTNMAPSAIAGGGVTYLYQPIGFSPTATAAVPPWSVNAGKLLGVYQGSTFVTTSAYQPINVQNKGYGVVLMSAEGGTAVNVNSNLIVSALITGGHQGARAGAFASFQQVGQASVAPVNTTITGPVATGSQVVVLGNNTIGGTPTANIYGITTTTVLTIDSIQSGVQEVVTPSAIVSGVNANMTFTVAAISAASTLSVTINGIVSNSYTTTAADTATTAAASLIQAIDSTPGYQTLLLPATNAAGVITVRAISSGTAYNSMTTVANPVVGGSTTLTASAGTMSAGTNSSFTAVFANAHGTGQIPVQGKFSTAGSAVIPGTASALTESLGSAYIQIV